MFISISVKKKRKVTDYDWYKFVGSRTRKYHDHNPVYELDLDNGEKFGIRTGRQYAYIIPDDMPEQEFKLTLKEASLLLKNSKGFSGKIAGTRVQAGSKGMEVTAQQTNAEPKPPAQQQPVNNNSKGEDKAMTKAVKSVKFPGIARIKHLMTQRTLLGEVYHYYDITPSLNAYRRKNALPIDKEGDFAIDIEKAVESSTKDLDAEISTMRYRGELLKVMSISEEE